MGCGDVFFCSSLYFCNQICSSLCIHLGQSEPRASTASSDSNFRRISHTEVSIWEIFHTQVSIWENNVKFVFKKCKVPMNYLIWKFQWKPSRASLTVRITVKNGDPSGDGKIWENRFFTGKMDSHGGKMHPNWWRHMPGSRLHLSELFSVH